MVMINWLVYLFLIYVAIGFFFALLFVSVGVQRIDPAVKGAPWTFRLLIIPGVAALWPLLLTKWIRNRQD